MCLIGAEDSGLAGRREGTAVSKDQAGGSRAGAAASSLPVCFLGRAPQPPRFHVTAPNPQRLTRCISVPAPDVLAGHWRVSVWQFQTTTAKYLALSPQRDGVSPLPLNLAKPVMALPGGVRLKQGCMTPETGLRRPRTSSLSAGTLAPRVLTCQVGNPAVWRLRFCKEAPAVHKD